MRLLKRILKGDFNYILICNNSSIIKNGEDNESF